MISPAPKPLVVRDESYREFVRGLPCLVCGKPGDAHHVKNRRGYGDAANLVPLCRKCHRQGHDVGWQTWEKMHGIVLMPVARVLWDVWKMRMNG